jgi:DnaJ-class molecular chaperone
MGLIEHACEDCGGTGSVRVHSHEDYGVSFECEGCEPCGGTGVDIPVLQADYRGAVEALREIDVVLRAAEDNGYDLALDAIESVVDRALRSIGGQ